MQAIIEMADGNPGAGIALMQIAQCRCDPNSHLGAWGPLLTLDSHQIYGWHIYVLFNDICEGNAVKAVAVLRAVQLGLFSGEVLAGACSREDRSGRGMVNPDELLKKVKERLPMFGQVAQEN